MGLQRKHLKELRLICYIIKRGHSSRENCELYGLSIIIKIYFPTDKGGLGVLVSIQNVPQIYFWELTGNWHFLISSEGDTFWAGLEHHWPSPTHLLSSSCSGQLFSSQIQKHFIWWRNQAGPQIPRLEDERLRRSWKGTFPTLGSVGQELGTLQGVQPGSCSSTGRREGGHAPHPNAQPYPTSRSLGLSAITFSSNTNTLIHWFQKCR